MHPYIPHLLTDIANAHQQETSEQKSEQSMEEHFEEIEKYVSSKEHTLGYYCGLQAKNFPPPEQLTEEEMILIRQALEKMMESWNHGIDLPENIPPAFAYELIVNSLNNETVIMSFGQVHFDFCTGNAPDCELKEYCTCLKIWNEEN